MDGWMNGIEIEKVKRHECKSIGSMSVLEWSGSLAVRALWLQEFSMSSDHRGGVLPLGHPAHCPACSPLPQVYSKPYHSNYSQQNQKEADLGPMFPLHDLLKSRNKQPSNHHWPAD